MQLWVSTTGNYSCFQTNDWMFKTGFGWANQSGQFFVLHGQVPLSQRWVLTPQYYIYGKDSYPYGSGVDYKAATQFSLGLEYRMFDHVGRVRKNKK